MSWLASSRLPASRCPWIGPSRVAGRATATANGVSCPVFRDVAASELPACLTAAAGRAGGDQGSPLCRSESFGSLGRDRDVALPSWSGFPLSRGPHDGKSRSSSTRPGLSSFKPGRSCWAHASWAQRRASCRQSLSPLNPVSTGPVAVSTLRARHTSRAWLQSGMRVRSGTSVEG